MSQAHRREKNPQLVRQSLIEQAGRLAATKGLAAVGVQQIADAAGVTKGGFFHHFPNKQALVDGVIAHLLASLDDEIDRQIALDPLAHGRFTRAYLALFLDEDVFSDPFKSVWTSLVADPGLKDSWFQWFNGRLKRHADTDSGPLLETVRFAADGLWLGQSIGIVPEDRALLGAHLLALTHPNPDLNGLSS